MPDALPRTRWQSLSTTPLRDLLRGRVTARLDWRSRLTAAGLPSEVNSTISRIVRRTHLWKLERAAVADELIAHFADGIAAGTSVDQLILSFGDERVAAKLIRRAKRRNRPLLWHVWAWASRAAAVAVAVYVGLWVRLAVGRPAPSVNYIALLNTATLGTATNDRAWPLWRTAILQCSVWRGHDDRELPEPFDPRPAGGTDVAAVDTWLRLHATDLATARAAAGRPSLGFVLGPTGSIVDPELFHTYNSLPGDPLLAVLLPHLNLLHDMAIVLDADARLAAESNDGDRATADVIAMDGMARQLRGTDGFDVVDLFALGVDEMAVERIGRILSSHPDALSDAKLVQLAHKIAGPRVAADLFSLDTERRSFADVVQRLYTDDGHGDGRFTWAGLQLLPMYTVVTEGDRPFDLAGVLPFAVASRAQVTAQYDRLYAESAANLAVPYRQADWRPVKDQLSAWRQSAVDRVRYAPILLQAPQVSGLQIQAERYLGGRDGLVVGLALELYHRRNGRYPATLTELTPELLPAVPADRITGDPLHYRLIDGKPVVYSVGADRIDNSGQSALGPDHKPNAFVAAVWDVPASDAPHGDWVLYPPGQP